MKPKNVDSVLFVGPLESYHTTFLYQFSIYWVQQGRKVLYVSKTRFTNIPPNIHGFCSPGAEELRLIRFVYLSTQQDLLKFLFSIHTHASVPSVIIVEGLQNYLSEQSDNHELLMKNALVAASLLDAASVCGHITKEHAMLIVAANFKEKQSTNMNMLSNVFFTEVVWLHELLANDDREIVVTNLESCPNQRKKMKFHFRCLANGELMLSKIVQLVQPQE